MCAYVVLAQWQWSCAPLDPCMLNRRGPWSPLSTVKKFRKNYRLQEAVPSFQKSCRSLKKTTNRNSQYLQNPCAILGRSFASLVSTSLGGDGYHDYMHTLHPMYIEYGRWWPRWTETIYERVEKLLNQCCQLFLVSNPLLMPLPNTNGPVWSCCFITIVENDIRKPLNGNCWFPKSISSE